MLYDVSVTVYVLTLVQLNQLGNNLTGFAPSVGTAGLI